MDDPLDVEPHKKPKKKKKHKRDEHDEDNPNDEVEEDRPTAQYGNLQLFNCLYFILCLIYFSEYINSKFLLQAW